MSFLDSPEGEAARKEIDTWPRTGGAFEAVFDLDAALADPAARVHCCPYDSDDGLHPNGAGCQAIADAVDLQALLRHLPCE